MRRTKQQMLNMQGQLEYLGKRLETFSRLNFNVGTYQELGFEYQTPFRNLDCQQACSRYKWKGLPDYISSQTIELMLYLRGSLCGFFKGGILYILPWVPRSGLNIYGQPNSVQPVTFNGERVEGLNNLFGEPLITSANGSLNKNAKAAILYDRIPVFSQNAGLTPMAVLNEEFIKYQADLLGRIKNNLKNVDKKIVFKVRSEAQVQPMIDDLRNAYGSTDPFIVVVDDSIQRGTDEIQGKPLQSGVDVETQSLFETWQSINSIRCMCMGITNGGAFEKKERKITGELQGDQTQTDYVLDAGLSMRKLFLQQMKAIYPDEAILQKIDVEINQDTVTTQADFMNGNEGQEEGGTDNE